MDIISDKNLDSVLKSTEVYAKAVYTDTNLQLVAMCLKPGECINKEIHHRTTQQFFLRSGYLKIEHWDGSCDTPKVVHLESGCNDVYVVPAGDAHKISNTSKEYRAFFLSTYAGHIFHPPCFVKECPDPCEC